MLTQLSHLFSWHFLLPLYGFPPSANNERLLNSGHLIWHGAGYSDNHKDLSVLGRRGCQVALLLWGSTLLVEQREPSGDREKSTSGPGLEGSVQFCQARGWQWGRSH